MADEKKDYYDLLGISRSANAEEIKNAYRRQAIKHHPDKNPGDKSAEAQFKAINEAYEVLSDSQKRSAYDRYGHAGINGGTGAGGFGGFGGFGETIDVDLGDILGNIFGGGDPFRGARRRGETRGRDIALEIEVSLREAYAGTQKPIRVQRAERCEPCAGSGAKPGTHPSACKTCQGSGQVRTQRGFFVMAQTCPTCGGSGRTISSFCPACRGQGRVERAKTITVRIPPGVREGTSLRIAGAGEAGPRGGASGDLYIVVHLAKDPAFLREGDDIYTDAHLSIPQAALGCEIQARTLEDPVTMKIPPGTQSGALFRLRDRGLPHLSARGRGDQFVRIHVDIPASLSREQREILRQFARSLGEDPARYEESVLRKIFGGS